MKLIFIFSVLISFSGYSQVEEPDHSFTELLSDSSEYRMVIKTMEFNGDRNIAMDNMTIKWNGEQTRVFYTKYGDMMISNVTIPYGIVEDLKKFEAEVRALDTKEENSKYSILFLNGARELIIPIDVLHVESLSSFMLSLEE